MKVIDLFEKTRCKTSLHTTCKDKIITTKDICTKQLLDGNGYYDKLYVIDVDKDDTHLEIEEGYLLNVTTTSSNNSVFYISLRNECNINFIDFNKMDIHTGEKKLISSINLGNNNFIGKSLFYMKSFFKALNDRYVLFIYNETESAFFDKAVLIDSDENEVYDINPELYYSDSLLMCDSDNCHLIDDKFIIKTGNLCTYEKEEMFKRGYRGNNKEQLLIIDTNSLIEDIKNDRKIDYTLINNKDDNGSLEVMEVNDKYIIYMDIDFVQNISSIRKHNMKKNESYLLERQNTIFKPNDFLYHDNNIYRIIDKQGEFKIHNVITNKLSTYNYEHRLPTIKYFDNNIMVMDFMNESFDDWNVLIYDMESSEEVQRYENRRVTYLKEIDSLVLH